MAELEIRLLGGLSVRHEGAEVTQFISGKVPTLLAYLAVTRRPHQRDRLAGLFWGEMPDVAAGNNLRQALTNLRKLLDPHLLITRDTVAFNLAEPHFVDVEALMEGLRLSGGQPAGQRLALLRQALDLYRGEFLEGVYVREAPDFEEWVVVQRTHLRELAVQGWDALTGLLLDSADYEGASETAGRLLAMDPWREEAHRQRMLALARSGQRSAALAQYQVCRRVLRQEFDVEPAAETTALYQRIRGAGQGPRHNLPVAVTGFVGREQELAELRRLLASPTTRLLTILGPGGVGKTRLAVEAARACEPMFLNGVWLAELTGVDKPAALPWALADALGFTLIGSDPPEPQLLDFLRRKELLLVLDNCERLIAPPALDLLCRIVQQAPDVKLLITSRARLNLSAERLYDLAGLPYPANLTAADIATYPAVELFTRRSSRVRPDFALDAEAALDVARICQLVEGLPLAIELAAAWSRTLSPADIAANLARGLALLASAAHDVPERHRSMAAVFDHSWRLLDQATQNALAQLAVCRGGFDRAVAQAVAGADVSVLQTLVDQSWLQVDASGRFAMHPLVQQFAGEKLTQELAALASPARSRHAHHYAALTAAHEHEFHGQSDRQALQWMLQETDNIRAAWAWGVQQADAVVLESFLESFLYYFDIQGRYRECVDLTGDALHTLQTAERTPRDEAALTRAKGRVLALHAAFQFRLGEFELAREQAEQALALLEPLRPHRDVGHARLYLGAAWYGLGDMARSVEWFSAAAAAYEEAGHDWGVGAALDNAGFLEFLRGNFAMSQVHLEQALAVAQRTGSRYLLTGVYDHLAALAAAQERFAEAMDYVRRCRAVLEELDRPYIVSSLLLSLSQVAVQAGDLATAQAHIDQALPVARRTGNRLDLVRFLLQRAAVMTARREFSAALAALQEAAAVAREIHAESLLLEVTAGLAERAWAMGERPTAAALYRFVHGHEGVSQEINTRAADRLARMDQAQGPFVEPLTLDQALSLGLGLGART